MGLKGGHLWASRLKCRTQNSPVNFLPPPLAPKTSIDFVFCPNCDCNDRISARSAQCPEKETQNEICVSESAATAAEPTIPARAQQTRTTTAPEAGGRASSGVGLVVRPLRSSLWRPCVGSRMRSARSAGPSLRAGWSNRTCARRRQKLRVGCSRQTNRGGPSVEERQSASEGCRRSRAAGRYL